MILARMHAMMFDERDLPHWHEQHPHELTAEDRRQRVADLRVAIGIGLLFAVLGLLLVPSICAYLDQLEALQASLPAEAPPVTP